MIKLKKLNTFSDSRVNDLKQTINTMSDTITDLRNDKNMLQNEIKQLRQELSFKIKTNITHRDMIHKINKSLKNIQEYLINDETCVSETESIDDNKSDETVYLHDEEISVNDEETIYVNEPEKNEPEKNEPEKCEYINNKLSEDVMIFVHNYIQKALITTEKSSSGKKKCYFPTMEILNENGITKDCVNHFGKMKGLKIKYKTWLHLKNIRN